MDGPSKGFPLEGMPSKKVPPLEVFPKEALLRSEVEDIEVQAHPHRNKDDLPEGLVLAVEQVRQRVHPMDEPATGLLLEGIFPKKVPPMEVFPKEALLRFEVEDICMSPRPSGSNARGG